MATILIEDIPLTLHPDRVLKRLRLGRTRNPEAEAQVFISRILALAEPRALYAALPIGDRSTEWVEVGGKRLTSSILAHHTRLEHQVFPYLVTLGPRVEEAVGRVVDLLEQYCLHEVANLALGQAQEVVRQKVGEAFGLPKLYSLAPGSLVDWPITEQRAIFDLLGDTDALLGVRLKESLLMLPQKSLSGIIFPSDRPFVSCRLCATHDCPGRQTPYDPAASVTEAHH